MSRDQAIVIRYDNPDAAGKGRELVYFHGRGSSEREAGMALSLFGNANVRSYRGPIAQGAGFAWFLNAGIGEAIPESLAAEVRKVGAWIAADTGRRRPWLCGFSNGAAMASALLLDEPDAYAGLLMIGGCFAVGDAELPTGGLAGKPILFCRGKFDEVIPNRKFEQAETYLRDRSGAHVTFFDYEGGHELPLTITTSVRAWLAAEERAGPIE
ncbi:MAG: esterase [Sphingopyxis sp.]|nr:esterase [Sphingopyxis sp.]